MPSEREIRKLYVNGRTICIEFFFYLFRFFSVRRTRSCHRIGTILEGSTSVLAGMKTRQNRKFVHIKQPMNITKFLIVLKQYLDCLRCFSKLLLKSMVEVRYRMAYARFSPPYVEQHPPSAPYLFLFERLIQPSNNLHQKHAASLLPL